MPRGANDHTASGPPASELLTQFADGATGDEVALDRLIEVLGDRVYGLVFLLLAIPNMIPGVALLLGLPLVLVAGQMVLGWERPRLPRAIGRRTLRTADLRAFTARAVPWLARAETMLRPRGLVLFGRTGERLLGAVVLAMAVVLTLPIWGANFLPALAIALIALALIERDGAMALLGIAAAAASVVVASGVIYAALKIALYLLAHAFS